MNNKPARIVWPRQDLPTDPMPLSGPELDERISEHEAAFALAQQAEERNRRAAMMGAASLRSLKGQDWYDGAPAPAEAATDLGADYEAKFASADKEVFKTLAAWMLFVLVVVLAGSWVAGWRPEWWSALPW